MRLKIWLQGGSWQITKLLCVIHKKLSTDKDSIDFSISFRIVKLVSNDNRNSRR